MNKELNKKAGTEIKETIIDEATELKPSIKQPLSVKNYRAFLINCLEFQNKNLIKLSEVEDKYHNLLRKSSSKSYSKEIRLKLMHIGKDIKKIKDIITNINISIQSLSEYENLVGIEYKLSKEFIKKEKPKYLPEEKENE